MSFIAHFFTLRKWWKCCVNTDMQQTRRMKQSHLEQVKSEKESSPPERKRTLSSKDLHETNDFDTR